MKMNTRVTAVLTFATDIVKEVATKQDYHKYYTPVSENDYNEFMKMTEALCGKLKYQMIHLAHYDKVTLEQSKLEIKVGELICASCQDPCDFKRVRKSSYENTIEMKLVNLITESRYNEKMSIFTKCSKIELDEIVKRNSK